MKKILGTLLSLGFLVSFSVPSVRADFSDVNGHWSEEYVEDLVAQGVVTGYGDGRYGPDDVLTRGQMAKIVVLAFDLDVEGSSISDYVDAVVEAGIAEGYKDSSGFLTGEFGENDALTRAQASKMLVLTADLNWSGSLSFTDVSSNDWFYNYVRAVYVNGVVSGYANSLFGPDDFVTRGQIAKMTVLTQEAVEEAELPVAVSSEEVEEGTSGGGGSGGGSSGAVEVNEIIIPEEISPSSNPFSGASFYVDPYSNAYTQIEEWSVSRSDDAVALQAIASQPTVRWFGDWNSDIEASVNSYVSTVSAAGHLPVMVAYNIPGRDCGNYSAGGSADADNYRTWIQDFADGVGERDAVVILEPDALSLDCLYENSVELLADAVGILKSNAHIFVYIDAGHPNWVSSSDMAARLENAHVSAADGFALNVSNFYTTEENIAYGAAISASIGGKHFILDTSRNGNGWNGEWCNPSGRSLGENPTSETGNSLADAFLWIKPPGESDGTCNGGPSAGAWWAEYALGLVQN